MGREFIRTLRFRDILVSFFCVLSRQRDATNAISLAWSSLLPDKCTLYRYMHSTEMIVDEYCAGIVVNEESRRRASILLFLYTLADAAFY